MHADEVQNVTSRLTAEAHEPLVLDVDEETGIVVFMERTQSLPPPRPGAHQPHSGSLDHIEKWVLELDLGDVAISSGLSSGHDRTPAKFDAPFTLRGDTPTPPDRSDHSRMTLHRAGRAGWSSPGDARRGWLQS